MKLCIKQYYKSEERLKFLILLSNQFSVYKF